MRRAVLLYNPRSGNRHHHRLALIERAASALRAAGIEVLTEPTSGPSSAGDQAKRLIARGVDTVIACGGDGTVHDILQGVVQSPANLGVIPLGTANALAEDLGLSTDPVLAAQQLLTSTSRRIAVGQIEYQQKTALHTKYFTVTAGIGMDAALFYRMNAAFKQRWGMAAYVVQSLRMWAFEKFHPFAVDWFDSDLNQRRSQVVTQLLVVRIANFGGVLNCLAPGADLLRDDFRLVLFKTASKARYLRFAAGRLLKQDWQDRFVELVHASEVSCSTLEPDNGGGQKIYAEADGEILGHLPVTVRTIPKALNLLIPATATCMQSQLASAVIGG